MMRAMPFTLAAACLVGCAAAARGPFQPPSDAQVQRELRQVHSHPAPLSRRVEAVSERFLGTPYKLGPLGEGPDGRFDRDPLVRFDEFDCTTFVETVMALSLESDLSAAEDTLQKIRYKDGQVGYATRNHFTELDWVPHNVWAGYLRDITSEVAGSDAVEVAKTISKRQWYEKKTLADFKGRFSEDEKRRALPEWQALGAQFQDERAALTILPMAALRRALPRIPSGTIANLVRTDQPDKETMVSHQVFLIKKKDGWYVRQASSRHHVVEDEPLDAYFAIYDGSKWPLLGLNLNVLRDPKAPELPR